MSQILAADLVTWEAQYHDGTVYREAQGGKYAEIDRNNLKAFRLVGSGELLLELPCTDGRNGKGLFYRRRTTMDDHGARKVVFIAGFIPLGPVVVIDPEIGRIYQRPAFSSEHAVFNKPEPLECEPWGVLGFNGVGHKASAVVVGA